MAETNGGVGHNSGVQLSDEQQEALFRSHMAQVRRLRARLASVNGDLRNSLKKAKAEGFTKADIDLGLALERDMEQGDGVANARRRRDDQIIRWLGHPIGTQGEMFTEGQDNRDFDAGKIAGMEGENPKAPEGRDAERWMAGWHAGQELLMSVVPLTAVAEEEKPKRGRGRPKGVTPTPKVTPFRRKLKAQNDKVEADIKADADIRAGGDVA